VLKTSTSPSP